MRSLLARHVALVLMCVAVVGVGQEARGQNSTPRVAGISQPDAEAPLTNSSIVKLVRAKFSEKTIIAIIRVRPVRFDLSPDRLIELKKSGVGERIILTMLARSEGDMLAAHDDAGDGFEDDPFFDGMRGSSTRAKDAGKAGGQGDPNEVNIFGSSGGARGRSRSSTGRGGVEGESQTQGSATVRILRPPAEAGGAGSGAEPKLERTPTLTNESVIELVEAGFSEGTIIRRIESSPVEFDFTNAKLAELRRRRVGEPIIAAMRTAMNEESGSSGANDSALKP